MTEQEQEILAVVGVLQYQVFGGRPFNEWAAYLDERELATANALARAEDALGHSEREKSDAVMQMCKITMEKEDLHWRYDLVVEQRNRLLGQLGDIAVALGTADQNIEMLLELIAHGYKRPSYVKSRGYEDVPF